MHCIEFYFILIFFVWISEAPAFNPIYFMQYCQPRSEHIMLYTLYTVHLQYNLQGYTLNTLMHPSVLLYFNIVTKPNKSKFSSIFVQREWYSVLHADGNSRKIDTFREAKLMICSQF